MEQLYACPEHLMVSANNKDWAVFSEKCKEAFDRCDYSESFQFFVFSSCPQCKKERAENLRERAENLQRLAYLLGQ